MSTLRRTVKWLAPSVVLFLLVWAGAMPKRWG